MRRIGARRATILRGLLGVVAAVGVLLVPTAAHATPSPGSIEKQIDEQWNKLEPIIEEYNKVHVELGKNQAQLKKVNKKLAPLQLQVDLAMAQVGGMAADAYKQGSPGALKAILLEGNPTGLNDKLLYLDLIAAHQEAQIADVRKLRDEYAADQQELQTLTNAVAARDKDLSAKKKQIQGKVDDLQKLRIQAYGASGVENKNFRLGTGACPVEYDQSPGNRAAQKACSLIGKPYIFGSAGPTGYDCSGLTQVAWGSVGVSLSHYTGSQVNAGRAISRSELRVGDLIFYSPGGIHHVSMYVGNGYIVHAPHTGDYVRMSTIDGPGTPASYRRVG
ncbi:C40 family peptidase [Symbioplanes lichenis]|uniref:C40 family peptidase n=1 Tax=Symbioplanes lichenis TaxID=1629072 RepID=UPI00273845EC|nr:C40 family peptidase [Actinoplanes lichenis]